MDKFPNFLILILISLITLSCEDDCTKTITHPGHTIYTPGGPIYYPQQTQEIPCDAPVPTSGELKLNVNYLQNLSVEVLEFNFTPDTGNNTSRLQFKIKLHNHNNTKAQGAPILTLLIDGVESTGNFSAQASIPCREIGANSSCTYTYNKETSLDLGFIETIELMDVQYAINSK